MTATIDYPTQSLNLPVLDSDLWPSRSGSVTKVAAAFATAQGLIGHAVKDSTNPHFKSTYADLASVMTAFKEAFKANGLSLLQPAMPSKQGTVTIQTIILHSSGEWLADRGLTMPAGSKAQEYGSALTYARRYALASFVGIAQDDDDGNAASASTAKPAARPKEEKINLATAAQKDALKARIDALPDALAKEIGENLRKTSVVWSRLTASEFKVAQGWVGEAEVVATQSHGEAHE